MKAVFENDDFIVEYGGICPALGTKIGAIVVKSKSTQMQVSIGHASKNGCMVVAAGQECDLDIGMGQLLSQGNAYVVPKGTPQT